MTQECLIEKNTGKELGNLVRQNGCVLLISSSFTIDNSQLPIHHSQPNSQPWFKN